MIIFFQQIFLLNPYIDENVIAVRTANDAFRLRLRNFQRDLTDREPIRVEDFDTNDIQLVDEFKPYVDANGRLGTEKSITRIEKVPSFQIEKINQYSPSFKKYYRTILNK